MAVVTRAEKKLDDRIAALDKKEAEIRADMRTVIDNRDYIRKDCMQRCPTSKCITATTVFKYCKILRTGT